ncbi:MAG: TRIC cation channel family protein [Candidatus Caenarcaniphilales bacterium]|nr:TRIC cation channel family protein [Candidatus Caenarcaniphilales bacterium]
MNFQVFLEYAGLFGVFIFAVSGALAASQKDMDLLGMLVLAVVTGTGGGTLCAVISGNTPAPLLQDYRYLGVCTLAMLAVFFGRQPIQRLERLVLVCDAFGLSIAAISTLALYLEKGFSEWNALLLGVVAGTGGGVIRDILRAEVPFILRHELYATPCLIGGLFYLGLQVFYSSELILFLISSVLIITIRLLAVHYGWGLPKMPPPSHQ